jgi:RNA-directed DNA polymerase
MHEAGADTTAEMPSRAQKTRRGTAGETSTGRQARTARGESSGDEALPLIEQVVRRENLLAAHARVVHNGGASGVDGMSVDELMPYCRQHWARIREQLLNGTYVPQPVRRVDIPKPDGKGIRTLGIPTVLDRLIQQALLQVLSPVFDPTFSDASFGFRPGRSTHHAVRCARGHIAAGHRWVVDMDLEKFFDRVNHDVLLARVARRV